MTVLVEQVTEPKSESPVNPPNDGSHQDEPRHATQYYTCSNCGWSFDEDKLNGERFGDFVAPNAKTNATKNAEPLDPERCPRECLKISN